MNRIFSHCSAEIKEKRAKKKSGRVARNEVEIGVANPAT